MEVKGLLKMIAVSKQNKRTLTLRSYQSPISDYALHNDISVLALCPNGGKTEISIDVIRRYLLLYPKAKILILTHSTNVLKDNYTDRLDGLDVNFTYSTKFNRRSQVHICLPQSEHLIKGHYDLLIVDEAHENYLAARVQAIIKKIKPDKQVLLTGTPAVFIKKGGYDIYPLAVNSIPEKYFSKLQIELVASSYHWAKKYNNQLEVKNDTKFTKRQTEKTLEGILLKLMGRFKTSKTNKTLKYSESLSWPFVYKKIGKTMIVCRSIRQAADVNNILNSHGVNSMVSDSKTDKDSQQIAHFKDNKYDVLIVVDRARLGYSDDGLFNIIDMSGTHNPNMIYQIFCRVLRGTPNMQKYYLKVTTQEPDMMDFTHACVGAALMLTDNRYLSTFNGDSFTGIMVPIIKKPSGVGSWEAPNNKKKLIFPEFTNDVVDMFKTIIRDINEPVSIYKLTTIKDVRTILSGRTIWTEEEIFKSAIG